MPRQCGDITDERSDRHPPYESDDSQTWRLAISPHFAQDVHRNPTLQSARHEQRTGGHRLLSGNPAANLQPNKEHNAAEKTQQRQLNQEDRQHAADPAGPSTWTKNPRGGHGSLLGLGSGTSFRLGG